MDRVLCFGTESYLVNCSYQSNPSAFDTHAKDVGIQCYGDDGTFVYVVQWSRRYWIMGEWIE